MALQEVERAVLFTFILLTLWPVLPHVWVLQLSIQATFVVNKRLSLSWENSEIQITGGCPDHHKLRRKKVRPASNAFSFDICPSASILKCLHLSMYVIIISLSRFIRSRSHVWQTRFLHTLIERPSSPPFPNTSLLMSEGALVEPQIVSAICCYRRNKIT